VNQRFDDDAQLSSVLQALSSPEPSSEFLTGARRRYLRAIEARERRRVAIGLVAALVGFAVIAVVLGTTIEPIAIVAWLAGAAAELARWTIGVSIVLAVVPPAVWVSTALASAAAVLSIVLIARARSLALVK